jgi:acetyl esterase/lipase
VQTPSVLSSLLPKTTIIILHYRLSPPTHTFPLPIHDTAIAFDYILRHFTNNASSRISLLGSRTGGTLATTLALTSPNSIHSVAVSGPIVDWVGLNTESHEAPDTFIPNRKKTKPGPYTSADAKSLLSLRSKLFPRPDNYFDPFASPTLFLRAPGRDCPQPDFDSPTEAYGPYDDDTYTRYHSPTSTSSGEDETAAIMKPIKRRKVLRRWPPHAPPESVELPSFRVFVGDDQQGEGMVLRQQGEELVELMKKVCFYGLDREIVETRVGLSVFPQQESEGAGGGILGEEDAARWLAQKLEAG